MHSAYFDSMLQHIWEFGHLYVESSWFFRVLFCATVPTSQITDSLKGQILQDRHSTFELISAACMCDLVLSVTSHSVFGLQNVFLFIQIVCYHYYNYWTGDIQSRTASVPPSDLKHYSSPYITYHTVQKEVQVSCQNSMKDLQLLL